MSTKAKSKVKPKAKKKISIPASVVWFEIPADDVKRAKTFYGKLFGWKVGSIPGMSDYWHIDTGGKETSLDGGLMARKQPGQAITNYILVPSVTKAMAKVEKLGGKVCLPKTTVPKMGHFAIVQDTEKNTFGIWEMLEKGK